MAVIGMDGTGAHRFGSGVTLGVVAIAPTPLFILVAGREVSKEAAQLRHAAAGVPVLMQEPEQLVSVEPPRHNGFRGVLPVLAIEQPLARGVLQLRHSESVIGGRVFGDAFPGVFETWGTCEMQWFLLHFCPSKTTFWKGSQAVSVTSSNAKNLDSKPLLPIKRLIFQSFYWAMQDLNLRPLPCQGRNA